MSTAGSIHANVIAAKPAGAIIYIVRPSPGEVLEEEFSGFSRERENIFRLDSIRQLALVTARAAAICWSKHGLYFVGPTPH